MVNEERLILDASVVVKWFHEEAGTVEAIILQNQVNEGRIRVDVPDLIFYEVTSALVLGMTRCTLLWRLIATQS